MGNKEYKTSEEVKQRAEEAIGHSFKEIFELAQKFQQENGVTFNSMSTSLKSGSASSLHA